VGHYIYSKRILQTCVQLFMLNTVYLLGTRVGCCFCTFTEEKSPFSMLRWFRCYLFQFILVTPLNFMGRSR
jgi:hypothetical protein